MDAENYVKNYIHDVNRELRTGTTTEHSFRPAFKTLVESSGKNVTAVNEPGRIACGAPDFVIVRGSVTVGYIEAKDVGKNLNEFEKHEQLVRYREALSNLILTDYHEFRWYTDGEFRLAAKLGSLNAAGEIQPDDAGIAEVTSLLDAFLSHRSAVAGTPKDLAVRMAHLTHMIKNLIVNAFDSETGTGTLHSQFEAFKQNLIPDLIPDDFADMYAQTIAYGLFAARCTSDTGTSFTRLDAANTLPKTNPFLRTTFQYIAGYGLDDRIAWLVDDLAQVLAQADMEAVLKGFGRQTGRKDPVIHFYETFLKEYDREVREMRGVYYTPEPVVSYIVRSVDWLLKNRFGRPAGLADEDTMILDPAAGTGTFLHDVISEIYQSCLDSGQKGTWNTYVREKLLPKLFGFELLMAPYAMAHLKLGLQLQDTEYTFDSDQRLNIYLTNTLEEAFKKSEQLAGFNEYIVEESNAAAEIKKDKPIMVVLGNPPYSVSSANKSKYINLLMERYKAAVRSERNIQPLSDDYIKFIRFAHARIEQTGYGIIGYITNNSYLSGIIHRGMRKELLEEFSQIYVLNLHGNSLIQEETPDGVKDENVFDIRQGVAIILCIKVQEQQKETSQYKYHELWGSREDKYRFLLENNVNTIQWSDLSPVAPHYFFTEHYFEHQIEYEKNYSIANIYSLYSSGMNSLHDSFVISFEYEFLVDVIKDSMDSQIPDEAIREKYKIVDSRDWKLRDFRDKLKGRNIEELMLKIKQCLYRPFDYRWIILDDLFVGYPRWETTIHFLRSDSLGFTTTKQMTKGFSCLPSRFPLGQHKIVDPYDRSYIFPLYLYPAEGELQLDGGKRRPNLNPEFIRDVSGKLGLAFIDDGQGDLETTFGPEDVFDYAYAVFHSPTYRSRYEEFLKIDFPRLPVTSDKDLFRKLAALGAELVSLHLMESPKLNNFITSYPVPGDNEVAKKILRNEKEERVYINASQYFEGVPQEVWEFQVGGYQVCEKWLKDRRGRKLTYDDLAHYQRTVAALQETIRLMAEIDAIIPGWPLE